MAGILDELLKKSTGMQSLLGGSGSGTFNTPDETYMPVEYSKDQAFTDPYTNTKKVETKFGPATIGQSFKYDPETGKPVDNATGEKILSTNKDSLGYTVPPPKPDHITELGKNPGLFKNIFGIDVKQMSANWKDKGGFEALMANPAFTVGAALLKSGSQGKSISAGAIDSLVTGGAISKQYADQIKKRQGLLAPVTEEQRESMKGVVGEQGITEPGLIDKMKSLFGGGNAEAMYREALDDIYVEAERLAKKDAAGSKTKVRFDPRKYGKQAIKNLQASGKLIVRKDRIYRAGTLQAKTSKIEGRAEGGSIQSGQDYVVGEKGPEMFVSETNGTIINNDDSKVVSMLLESNPQLKNVSKARAVKILKARFPDYF